MDCTFEGYRTPLQRERRLRGWKQQYVVDQIKQLAHGDGYRKTFDGFEVNALSRLENGRIQRPRDPLPTLFAKLYGKPEEALFPTPASAWNGAVQVGNQALSSYSPGLPMEALDGISAKYCVFEVRVGLLLADGVCGGRPGDATVHIQPAGGVHGVLGGAHGQADGDHVLVVAVDAGPPDRKAPLAGRALVAQPAQRVAGAVLVFGVDVGELGAKAHVDPGELGPVPLRLLDHQERQGALGGLGDRSGHGPMMPCGSLSAPTAASGRFADGTAARPQDPLAGPPCRLAAQAAQTHRAGAHRPPGWGAARPDRAGGVGGAGHRAHRPPAGGAAGDGAQVAAAMVPAGPGGAWGSASPWPAAGLPPRGGRRGQGACLRAAGHPRRAAEPLESWRAAPGGHRRRAGRGGLCGDAVALAAR